MSLRPLVTHFSNSQSLYAPYTTTGGGGGGGSIINTSTITTSTLTVEGLTQLNVGGPTNPLAAIDFGVDPNVFTIATAPSTTIIYSDQRLLDGNQSTLASMRTELASLGEGRIEFNAGDSGLGITAGLRFVSSLNGGPPAILQVQSTINSFPLDGGQFVAIVPAILPAGGASQPLTAAFSTISGHSYSVDMVIGDEQASGAIAANDRMSYVVGANVITTVLLSEISTLGGANPRGRTLHGVFTAAGPAAQVTVNGNTTMAGSATSVPSAAAFGGCFVKDLGPTNLVIAP